MTRTEMLDLKGLKCPHVAIATKRTLQLMSPGDVLKVLCTDPMAALDLPLLAQQLGHEAIVKDGADDFFFAVVITLRMSDIDPSGVWPCED